MATNVEDVVNQALMAAGIKRRIADIYEGSDAAKVAIELYGQARDELLRLTDWSFSRRRASLTLLKGPPPDGGYSADQPWTASYPPPGFLYEYTYPSDCLDVRAIISPPGLMPDLDPLPALWRIDNDPTPNVSPGVQASGTILFSVNPSPGDTITLNGISIEFVAGTAVGYQLQIDPTCFQTIDALGTFLGQQTDAALTPASYLGLGPGPDVATLQVTYKTTGTAGNAYTLAASAATPSGSHLTGGVDGPIYSGPPAKVILCNMTDAMLIYRARITDPASWEPGFTAALVASLGKKFARAFDEDMNVVEGNASEAGGMTRTFSDVRG